MEQKTRKKAVKRPVSKPMNIEHVRKLLSNLEDKAVTCHKEWINKKLTETVSSTEKVETVKDGETLLRVVESWEFKREIDLAYLVGQMRALRDLMRLSETK